MKSVEGGASGTEMSPVTAQEDVSQISNPPTLVSGEKRTGRKKLRVRRSVQERLNRVAAAMSFPGGFGDLLQARLAEGRETADIAAEFSVRKSTISALIEWQQQSTQPKHRGPQTLEGRSAARRKAWANLSPFERAQREANIWNGRNSIPAEERSDITQKGWDNMSEEDRTHRVAQVVAGIQSRTPEERSASVRKGWEGFSPQERLERLKNSAISLTPEELSVIAKKAWDDLDPEQRQARLDKQTTTLNEYNALREKQRRELWADLFPGPNPLITLLSEMGDMSLTQYAKQKDIARKTLADWIERMKVEYPNVRISHKRKSRS